ncbi:energy transducer TonB [Phenylobacterium sp. LjRoot164]|uniref:TonB family protein n=1 Tax=unclassified Phenylobacterium TaxID=2640670 RepID=UPI003ECF8225
MARQIGAVFLGGLMFACCAAPGLAQDQGRVAEPEWAMLPSGADFAEAFPAVAMALDLEGFARIDCHVDANGVLGRCRVLEESPAGLGFGQAAKSMAAKFKMKPKRVDGVAVAGGEVAIPIRFRLPQETPLPPLPKAPDAERLALARRLADVQGASGTRQAAVAGKLAQLRTRSRGVAEPAVLDAAIAALNEAGQASSAEDIEGVAQVYALAYSADELRLHLAFHDSDAGRALAAYWPQTLEARRRLQRSGAGQVRDLSRTIFCASYDCRPEPDFPSGRAPSGGAGMIYEPVWAQQPDRTQTSAAYPVIPTGLGLDGWAGLVCDADPDGLLSKCRVEAESPAGLGFGAAALSLAGRYRLSRSAHTGAERQVWLAMPFRSPWAPTPSADYPGLSGARLQLAREAVLLENGGFSAVEADADWAATRREAEAQGVAAATIDAARAAKLEARAKVYDLRVEAMAGLLGQHLDEAQLKVLVAYRRTEAYQQESRRLMAHKDAMALTDAASKRRVAARAQALFCNAHACEARPAPAAGR